MVKFIQLQIKNHKKKPNNARLYSNSTLDFMPTDMGSESFFDTTERFNHDITYRR